MCISRPEESYAIRPRQWPAPLLRGLRVSGAPVTFYHGYPMDREMIEPQVAAISDEFRCISWDERGFGQTPVTGPFTFWDSADSVLALLTHPGIDAAFFVGNVGTEP